MEPSEPPFTSRPGQVDYTNIRYTPVVTCVVRQKDMVLVVQRSPTMRLYPGLWNGISGFLDDDKSIEEKTIEELQEELGITAGEIIAMRRGTIFHQEAPDHKKTWIVHPLLVDVTSREVTLDWEAREYRWVTVPEVGELECVPGFEKVIAALFP